MRTEKACKEKGLGMEEKKTEIKKINTCKQLNDVRHALVQLTRHMPTNKLLQFDSITRASVN